MLRIFLSNQRGGVTLEAALIMPIFLAFVLALAMFIRLAVTEMALKSAAVETTKIVATHMYPVELLLAEAKQKFDETRIGAAIGEIVDRAKSVQDAVESAEQFVDDYAAWIPDPLLQLMAWEKDARESVEGAAGQAWDDVSGTVLQPMLNAAMKPLVRQFADMELLEDERLEVSKVQWLSFSDRSKAYVGIELKYRFSIKLPFFRKDIIISKKAYERAWLGA